MSRPGAVRTKDAAARGVWGHAPPGNISILDSLRSILVHFGMLFQHGKALVQTEVQTASLRQICYATNIVRTRRTIDQTPPNLVLIIKRYNSAELQARQPPDETVEVAQRAVRFERTTA